MTISIGTAGWTIPRQAAEHFPRAGSSLERYASCFPVAEINSSFHRLHRLSTWERWRDSVPDHFRFSVKLPKTITHQTRLDDCATLLAEFLEQAHVLGRKLAVLLVQLPPKLEFDEERHGRFFRGLAELTDAQIACEPRNVSWFTDDADAQLAALKVARVAADPALSDVAARPGGWGGLLYWRLHGSPHMYRSSYENRIGGLAEQLSAGASGQSWCIFDNTASSAATSDALKLMCELQQR